MHQQQQMQMGVHNQPGSLNFENSIRQSEQQSNGGNSYDGGKEGGGYLSS